MPVIVYVDETGDHTLELVDKDFPVFVLVPVWPLTLTLTPPPAFTCSAQTNWPASQVIERQAPARAALTSERPCRSP